MSDTIYWIWLANALGAGSRYLPYILERYSSPYELFRADSEEIERLELTPRIIKALLDKDMSEAYEINDHCASHNIGIITYAGKYYPERLRMLKDPPAVLYFKGTFPQINDTLSLGVVGTRKMTEYGKRSAYKIAYELAAAGVTVVSGMALGIDAVSSVGAICGGGKTIAVLGSGVDVVYPPEHTTLYNKIIEHGAVISEYPPTSRPIGSHFPVRNRIISGMTNGTLVIEGDNGSGSLITAKRALEQGRDIFALPGNIESKTAIGTNQLIHDGATMVIRTEDILNQYEFYYGKTFDYIGLELAKTKSDLKDEILSEMGVFRKGRAIKEKNEDVEVDPLNILRPRKKPKKKSFDSVSTGKKEEPSSEKKNTKEMQRDPRLEAIMSELSEEETAVLKNMPDDRAVNVDYLIKFGLAASTIMGTLAILEIKGLVSSLPGGLYIKN